MRKNNRIFKKVTSLMLTSMMLATSLVYAQETEQVVLEETATADFEESESLAGSSEEFTVEDQMQQETTLAEESNELQTDAPETLVSEEEQIESSTIEQEEKSEEPEGETTQEDIIEATTEEDTTEEASLWPTEEFGESAESSSDSDIHEIGDEFIKTFSVDMTVDSNPIYLGMAGSGSATGSYYDQLDATSKRIYTLIYNANKSSASTVKIKLNLTKIFENQKVTKGSNGKAVYEESTKQAIFAWLGSYVTPAYLALSYDHPELVWLSGAKYNIGYSVYTPIFYDGETSIVTDLELAGSTFTLIPSSDTGALTASKVDPLFDGTKSQIDGSLSANATRYDTVKAIHDKICSMVQYEDNTQNIGNAYYQTPYSLYYDADGDGKIETVCAGYAKMMKLQCDNYGIPCVLVTGVTNTGEYHMWNYIQMEDSAWYAVDATWDDQSTILYDFFLVGSETYSSAAFGTKKFGDTHIPSGKWTTSADCVFQYPVFSKTAYKVQSEPVKSGLIKDSDGVWRYYKENKVDTSYTGLATSENEQIYLKNGVQDTSYTSLLYSNGSWYYVQKGAVNTQYSGLASYNGNWYYVKSGAADWTYTGLSQYNGVWYYVKTGSINWDYTGLCQYNNVWYYVKSGAIDWSYTGLCQESGVWYYIKKGQVDWNYTGTCMYNGSSYSIENGVLNWKYDGSALYSSASYAKDSMSAMVSVQQSEETSIDVTSQYAAQEQIESVSSAEEIETEAPVVEQTTSSQIDPSIQESQSVPTVETQKSLLECIEQYLIQLIMNLIKCLISYIQ